MSNYLEDKTFKIRAKQIPWEGYQRAGLLSAEDVSLIQRVSPAVLASETTTYSSLFVRLLNKLSRNDTLQFILVLIDDMLFDHEDRIKLFLTQTDNPYPALLKLLDSTDDFIKLKSTVILSTFLAAAPSLRSTPSKPTDDTEVAQKLINHLAALIKNEQDVEGQAIAVESLEKVLRLEEVRTLVWAAQKNTSTTASPAGTIIAGLITLLKQNPSSQMQYEISFCFWLMTFDAAIATGINSKYHIIPVLADVAKNALKEKVTRIVVAAFRNLITKSPTTNLPAMLVCKVLPLVQSLGQRRWSDEEIKEDLDWIEGELKENFEGLTTYDEYKSELESGELSWTPTHNNEEFWKENAVKLNEKDKVVLKRLIELLKTSKDPLVLAVAASDIAYYIKFCDVGKKTVEQLGARGRIMELMAHEDADVKFQALVCVQRLISQPWA